VAFSQENDGGIVTYFPFPFFVISVAFDNPSVSFADSSLYTREPLTQKYSALAFYLLSVHRQSLF